MITTVYDHLSVSGYIQEVNSLEIPVTKKQVITVYNPHTQFHPLNSMVGLHVIIPILQVGK